MMNFPNENYNNYLLELLNFPSIHRCGELGLLIDRCSIKDLQDFFPQLIQSVFGNYPGGNQLGWGLRTICSETNPQEFDVLRTFFNPMGPMFRLCYRLLNEPIKFDVPIEILPSKTCEMLYSGRYSQFYADTIQIDPSIRLITSLTLNAFDYFILHFAVHGMQPLHQLHPAALLVHNDKRHTVYTGLCLDIMNWFLPSHPDAVVMPSNICGTVKMTSVMTSIQTIQPVYSPKYLKMSALTNNYGSTSPSNHHTNSPNSNANQSLSHSPSGSPSSQTPIHLHGNPNTDSPLRSYSWRTESILYLFTDTWLRYDIDANRELPSCEFIFCVRIFIKFLHGFANSAELDRTPMFQLRQLAHPMLNAQIYTFLRSLIKRWPLDSSFSVVLKLWLAYIQPWRYSFEQAPIGRLADESPQQIPRKFQYFIKQNMVSYTQILVQLLPRFERLDLSSLKNTLMMNRLMKAFAQTNLAELLRANEFDLYATKSFLSSSSPKTPKTNKSRTSAAIGEYSMYRPDSLLQQDEDNYVCLFGDEVQQQIWHICEKMMVTKQIELNRCAYMEAQQQQRNCGLARYFKWFLVDMEDVIYERTLNDCRKIPELIDKMLHQMSYIFDMDLPDPSFLDSMRWDASRDSTRSNDMDISFTDFSGSNRSASYSMARVKDVEYTVDPAQVPTQSNELTFMVRFLYQLSSKLNFMYKREMADAWHRNDQWGRLARQILHPPMVAHRFDKSQGFSVVCEQRLTPRLNLRFLAKYQTMSVVLASFVFGQLMFDVPSFGFLLLLLVTLFYLFVMSIVNDPK